MAKKKAAKIVFSDKLHRERASRVAYDAASQGRLSVGRWRNDGIENINAALASDVSILRRRARYELRSDPDAAGLQRVTADLMINTGPILQIDCPDDQDWADEVERRWLDWSERCGYLRGESFGKLLHQGIMQLFPCGEFLWIPRTDTTDQDIASLRLLPIRPDRLQTPQSGIGDDKFYQGIKLDDDGRPVRYYILKKDPTMTWSIGLADSDFDDIAREQLIHYFLEKAPGQLRGEPWLAQGLNIYSLIRRFNEATLAAAEVAPMFAAMIGSTSPDLTTEPEILDTETFELSPGTATVMPPGYGVEQVKPEHPANTYKDFRRENFKSAARPANIPVNIATGDSSGSNFASARLDSQVMYEGFRVILLDIENQACNPVFRWWLQDERARGAITVPAATKWSHSWLWPAIEHHYDPVKRANASGTNLKNGVTSLKEECARRGIDFRQHIDQLEKERKLIAEKGIRLDYIDEAETNVPKEGGGS